jgi:hypothetical protein
MSGLNSALEVADLASALGLRATAAPAERIVRHCIEQIEDWVAEAGGVSKIDELEKLICRKKSLVVVEIWSDEALKNIIHKYVDIHGEKGFAVLSYKFEADDAFGCLMERYNIKRGARDRYVAFIDCRGKKAQRRFFTRWHEIAHALTLVGQLELPLNRDSAEHPIEKLMDTIAGEVGFYQPLFQPALDAELERSSVLTFAGVERIKSKGFSDASFQASFITCVKRTPTPLLWLQAELNYKKCEMAELGRRVGHSTASHKPQPKLRAVCVVPNEAARKSGLFIPKNLRIPEDSIIFEHYTETDGMENSIGVEGCESLAIWQSHGRAVGIGEIHVDVKRSMGTMLALIRPI